MLRAVLLGAALLAGCASAGSGGSNPGGSPDAGRDGSTGGLSDGGATDAALPSDAALMACAGADTCQGAIMLGTVSGDSGNAKLTASGYRSAWYRVRVTENDSSVFGLSLRVAAKLTSPSAPAFDVFVYVNTGSDVVECATTTGTVSTSGNTKQVRAEWGEGSISNGSDDGRSVSIEVRPLATSGCSPSATWQLEIEGNWI